MKRLLFVLLFFMTTNISPSSFVKPDSLYGTVSTALKESVVQLVDKSMTKPFIPDSIFEKQLIVESGGKQTVLVNGQPRILRNKQSGAVGIAQFLPSTWNGLKKKKLLPNDFSIENECHQRQAQKIYMNQLANLDYKIEGERLELALASYNAGYGRVTKLIRKHGKNWKSYLPKQTKEYLSIILEK